jgi:hypothetical protein
MVSRWSIVLLAACSNRHEAAPPPPSPTPVVVDAAIAPAIDAASDAAIDAAEPDALDPEMAKVLASPPCCCALASTEPEFEMQPRLLCQQDTHGTCVARTKCPAAGSVEELVARWWGEAANGEPQKHAAQSFVVELFPNPDVFTGLTCGRPYVVDMPSPKDECLRVAIANYRPPAKLRAGWDCKGFSETDLAKRLKTEHAGDRLVCGNKGSAGIFVAVDNAGNITAFLVNTYASR